ncbi:MAG: MerR family transcriptional regulator [Solirubrobacteraceae bacterium MAG38_C4-C5]|nr:MerR family transcriptional regulator [Candidatus Siliceabacter maunaloa]
MEHTVKQVAQRVELPSRTVRYYDRIGLVSPQKRSEAGYRLYGPEDEGRLHFVRQAKRIGFSLDEIRELIAAAQSGCCDELVPELERLLADKVAQVDERIADLHAFRGRLTAYQAGRGSSCGCSDHGAFCGCLNDAPVPETKTKEVTSMACQCGCNTTTETTETTDPTTTDAGECSCGCADPTRSGDACGCGGEKRDADGEPQTA